MLVEKAARVIGVLDDYGELEEDQVFIKIAPDNYSTGTVIKGKVVITKNPCLHPGDIRVVNAVDNE